MPSKYAIRYDSDVISGKVLAKELVSMLKYLKKSGYEDVPRGAITLSKIDNDTRFLNVGLILQKCAKKKKNFK